MGRPRSCHSITTGTGEPPCELSSDAFRNASRDGYRSESRTMEILGIDVAFYHSNDMAASKEWYQRLLGQDAAADYGDWVEFDVGGSRFGIDSGNTATEIPNAVVSFRVSDLDAAITELRARGVEPSTDVIDVGPARIVALRDPSGNMVQLSQPKAG